MTEAPRNEDRQLRSDCPACESAALRELLHIPAIPVQSCVLLDSAEEGAEFPRNEMRLTFCEACGFVFNSAFDERLIDYASTTEESQHFSDTFNAFARKLVSEIASIWNLDGSKVLEIGCGKGDFLRELCMEAPCDALGVDPGFIAKRLEQIEGASLRFQREYFDPETVAMNPDLVICRHTLEHIGPVKGFLEDIHSVVSGNPHAGLFFETPDVGRVLREGAFWDIYFEHCSYFTPGVHARLFRATGFDVTALRLDYDGQYIIQNARLAADTASPACPAEEPFEELSSWADSFPEKVAETMEYWREFTMSRHRSGQRVVVWGGGSKCVSFLTTLGVGSHVSGVVDINPYKQNRYLPGTGLRVEAPQDLIDAPPDTVIIMNPIYLKEITASLARMGLSPEIVAV